VNKLQIAGPGGISVHYLSLRLSGGLSALDDQAAALPQHILEELRLLEVVSLGEY